MQSLKHKESYFTHVLAGLSAVLLVVLVPASVMAQTVTQSYKADTSVKNGMIVELDSSDTTKVDPLPSSSIQSMQGVIVAATDAAVTLSGGTGNQVYVATGGTYKVLVSTQNGTVKPGDYITISSLSGIGMKASAGQSIVLGKALEGFNGITNVSSTVDLATTTGTKAHVAIGLIQVDIGISHNPLASGVTGSNVPGLLRKSAESLANKPVSPLRIYLGLVILTLTTIVVGVMLYAAVRSSLISIGRNPLARKSIIRGLIQAASIGLIVFVLGIFAVYLILTL